MTNKQLAAARRAQHRYPGVAFRADPAGIRVNGRLVEVSENMSPEDVLKALLQEAANG